MKKPIAAITENREIRMPNMMLNMPNRISPMIPTTKLPAQKAMFDVAVTTADNAFHNTFPMSLNIILIFSDFRLLIYLVRIWSGRFLFLFASLYVRCFLVTSSDRIGRFRFGVFSKVRE